MKGNLLLDNPLGGEKNGYFCTSCGMWVYGSPHRIVDGLPYCSFECLAIGMGVTVRGY